LNNLAAIWLPSIKKPSSKRGVEKEPLPFRMLPKAYVAVRRRNGSGAMVGAPRNQQTLQPSADLVISYATNVAALAGTLRAMAGPNPLNRPLTPSAATIFLAASTDPEYLGFL
jgi:hypothetical protein